MDKPIVLVRQEMNVHIPHTLYVVILKSYYEGILEIQQNLKNLKIDILWVNIGNKFLSSIVTKHPYYFLHQKLGVQF